ncbi:MAG: hypothetical protein RR290_01580 [Clostridia bacterium]
MILDEKDANFKFLDYTAEIKDAMLISLNVKEESLFGNDISTQYDNLVLKYNEFITNQDYNQICCEFIKEVSSLVPFNETM